MVGIARHRLTIITLTLLGFALCGVVATAASAAQSDRRGEVRAATAEVVLAYSTFLGGGAADEGLAVTVDARGDIFIAGRTASPDFPATPGTVDTTSNGDADAFVAKIDREGQLQYATLLGGSSFDDADAIAVDARGNAFVRGVTRSPDFPTTPGAFDTTFNGGFDVYVAKVAPDGSAIGYSTFIGGTGFDSGSGIAINPKGEAYLTGITGSPDFPTTPDAFDTTFTGTGGLRPPFLGGDFDAYVTKLASDGGRLEYSTFLGGARLDAGFGIAVGPRGEAYVVGPTGSPDFPTTPGAHDTTINGPPDAFVTSLTPDGSALRYSTFFGGDAFDDALGVTVDRRGHAYVTGGTESVNFPTTAGANDTTFNGDRDAYVTRLAPDGSHLVWSTFIGGGGHDFGGGVAIDRRGDAFVTGTTASPDFPTTSGAVDNTFNGVTDGFLAEVGRTGSLVYSTFLGGAGSEDGTDVAVDPRGDAFVTGTTASPDFPTTSGAVDDTFNGVTDAFAAEFERREGRAGGPPCRHRPSLSTAALAHRASSTPPGRGDSRCRRRVAADRSGD